MNRRNFLIVILLFFSKIFTIKCETCKIDQYLYVDYDCTSFNGDFELRDNMGIEDIRNSLKAIYNYSKLEQITEAQGVCVIELLKKNDIGEVTKEYKTIKKNEKINLATEKPEQIFFNFFTEGTYEKIKKCKLKKVKILDKIFDLSTPIDLSKFFQYFFVLDGTSTLATKILEYLKTLNLTTELEIDEKKYGEKIKIKFKDLLDKVEKGEYDSHRVKRGDVSYLFNEDGIEDLVLELNFKAKKNITLKFKTPKDYILDSDCLNNFTINLLIDNFSTQGILEGLTIGLKEYFNKLVKDKKTTDPNFKPTYDLYSLDYHFNSIEEPINPISYLLTNSKKETLKIDKEADIINTNVFNLNDGSTIEIEVGEKCELLKTIYANIKLKPLEGTELNGEITNKNHKILLNLKDSTPENIKKQIVDYFISKKYEGLYIPEEFYEHILNTDEFYNGPSDHFELNINLNEKAKGTLLKLPGTSDPNLDYLRNYDPKSKEQFNPPTIKNQDIPDSNIPEKTEEIDKKGIDKGTMCCAKCGGKCLKCSNCNKNPVSG